MKWFEKDFALWPSDKDRVIKYVNELLGAYRELKRRTLLMAEKDIKIYIDMSKPTAEVIRSMVNVMAHQGGSVEMTVKTAEGDKIKIKMG